MPRRSASLELAVEQTDQLERWIRAGATPQQVVLRAKIVRQAAAGSSDKQIAVDLGVHPRTVALWRQRVRDEGVEGIWQVAAGRGRKPTFGATTVSDWIERTLHTQPDGATHWSTRSLGRKVGVSKNTIHPGLAGSSTQAALDEELQAVAGPAVCGEAHGRGRRLFAATQGRRGAVCG